MVCTAFTGLSACGGGGGGNAPPPPPPATFSLSQTTVNFSTTATNLDPQNPATVTIRGMVSGTATGTLYILVSIPQPSVATVSDFQITGNTSGEATVTPGAAAALGAGSFSETITVKACLNDATCATGQLQGSPQTLKVNYTVDGLATSTTALNYTIGNAPTAANLVDNFQVTGYPSQTWKATSSAPWLALTPTSGSTSASVGVAATLDATQINALSSGTYMGSVTLTPTSGLAVTLPVTLNIARTQVDFVAPHIAISGTTGNVIVRGENFSLITPTGVNFGSTPASSFTVISDTEIHAAYPALTAGVYDVHIVNSQGIDRTQAQLTVVNPVALAAGTLQYPAHTGSLAITGLLYDAARQSLFADTFIPNQGVSSGSLLRYDYTNSWSAANPAPLAGDSAIAEAIDGSSVLAAYQDQSTHDFVLSLIDPMTLTALSTVTNSNTVTGVSVAPSNNGHIIVTATNIAASGEWPILDYSMLSGSLVQSGTSGFSGTPSAAASLDGSMILVQASGGILNSQTLEYNSNSDMLAAAPHTVDASAVQVNRDGSRVLLVSLSDQFNIYDANINLLGNLPASTLAMVFGPVSSHVYTYDNNGTVRTFDLSQPPVAGVFPEILPAITPIQSPESIDTVPMMIVTPDEQTLFLAGDAQIVVVPL